MADWSGYPDPFHDCLCVPVGPWGPHRSKSCARHCQVPCQACTLCAHSSLCGSSLINAGGLSWVAEAHRPEERGTATAGAMAGLAAGVLFGPTIGGLLYPVKLWDFAHATPFCCVAGVILLDAIVQLTLNAAHPGDSTAIGEEKEEEEEGIEPSLGTLLCDRQVPPCWHQLDFPHPLPPGVDWYGSPDRV